MEVHIAIIERTEGMDEAQFAKVMEEQRALSGKIDGVQILVGENTASTKDKYSHAVIVIAEDLAAYYEHPELKALVPSIEALGLEGYGVDFVDGKLI